MGVVRLLLVAAAGAALLATVPACSSSREGGEAPAQDATEPEQRVPDPPPRYKHVDLDSGIVLPGEGSGGQTLHIKCGGNTPYVCSMDDGSIKCSDHPCLPDCVRLGCLADEICRACDGGYRCVVSGDSC